MFTVVRVMQFSNGTLAFLPAEPEDTGVYTCRAKNTVGDDRQQVVLFVAGEWCVCLSVCLYVCVCVCVCVCNYIAIILSTT